MSLRSLFRAAFVAALAVLQLAGNIDWAGAAAPPPIAVSGPSPFASCPSVPPAGQAYLNIETEPRLALSSFRAASGHAGLIGVWIQDAQTGDVAGYSLDGGVTWAETPLPFSACAPGGLPYQRALDPWISVGPDGRAYAGGLALTPGAAGSATDMAIAIATSVDGGKSWQNVHALRPRHNPAGVARALDKPTVTADPTRAGTAYAVWQEEGSTDAAQPVGWFARTPDGGRTWSRPRVIVPSVKGSGAYYHEIVADARSHRLYDVFNLLRPVLHYHLVCTGKGSTRTCRKIGVPVPGRFNGYVAFATSGDRGTTWSAPRVIARDRAIGLLAVPAGQLTAGAGIDATVDPTTGRLYAVWTDARFTSLMYDEVLISSSSDQGAHWSAPRPVSTAATSFNPTVAVNSAGTVAVTYYDLRDVAASATGGLVDVWFTASTDRGATFTGETKLGAFDISTAPVINGGYFIGDYAGLAAVGATFLPFFVMTTGQPADPTEVYFSYQLSTASPQPFLPRFPQLGKHLLAEEVDHSGLIRLG